METVGILLLFALACALAAAPGLIFRPGTWYRELKKPAWCPPDRLFGPVWLVLYLSIAISGWLVWRQAGFEGAAAAFGVYFGQLLLNGLWSTVFFGLRRLAWAFLEIICLLVAIAATIVAFHPIDAAAAYLLLPYALWVGFAALLNLSILRLNPGHFSFPSR